MRSTVSLPTGRYETKNLPSKSMKYETSREPNYVLVAREGNHATFFFPKSFNKPFFNLLDKWTAG